MNSAKPFLQFGACICLLIGIFYTDAVWRLISERVFYGWSDAVILVAYTLLCFLPFALFIYPELKRPGRSVLVVGLISEILVVGFFVWNLMLID